MVTGKVQQAADAKTPATTISWDTRIREPA